MENRYRLDVNQIQKYLPHRAPFLMLDRILEIHPVGDLNDLSPNGKVGIKVVGLKNISYGEPAMQGHFPGFAIMPGVLVLEAMAQTASFSLYPYVEKNLQRFATSFSCVLVGMDGVRFRRPIVPGDSLRMESTVTKCRGKLWGFHCEATVDGQRAAEVDILANLMSGELPDGPRA